MYGSKVGQEQFYKNQPLVESAAVDHGKWANLLSNVGILI